MASLARRTIPRFLALVVVAQLLAASCQPIFAGEIATGRPKNCVPKIAELLLTGKLDPDMPLTAERARQTLKDATRRGLKPRVIAAKVGKFLVYPTLAPYRLWKTFSDVHGIVGQRTALAFPLEYVRRDGLTVVGFLIFLAVAPGSPLEMLEFYLLPKNKNDDFEKDTAVPPRSDGILVYVDAVPDDNELAGYGENDFKLRFKPRDGAYYIHATGIENMMSQLAALSRGTGKPIAELEILAHGMPGEMSIGGETLSVWRAGSLGSRVEGLRFAKDATIRLQSCFVGANFESTTGKSGENFMTELGRSLLTDGGTVIASNRIIYVTDHFPSAVQRNHKSLPEAYFDKAMVPLEAVIRVGLSAFETGNEPYRRVAIPPRN
ncbi:MAG: hypothetical protein HY075_14080 [Deltaproteobacteria bacterium]|nr:hypothetical protein [Deltaproteobacteria bacterium]